MSGRRPVIYFWQRIVSPHMAGLAAALAQQDCDVAYVAERSMSEDRARQGWIPPDLGGARLKLTPTRDVVVALVKAVPAESIHICQGIRSNGLVGVAQHALAGRGLRQWVVMETVDDTGWRGVLKRLEYRRLFAQWRKPIEGVLATGWRTPDWVMARGMVAGRVFPFAYFLPRCATLVVREQETSERFRFIFVGQFIERKRLDLLISALATLNRTDAELVVIGSGPLESEWKAVAETALSGCVNWIGRLPMHEVSQQMAKADCLVLPSRYDGWGAVVSEALMVGTPAICSDRCGSAGMVWASGQGGVFRSGDRVALTTELRRIVSQGRSANAVRMALAAWARCLGAEAGASYLRRILDHAAGFMDRPTPPWAVDRELK